MPKIWEPDRWYTLLRPYVDACTVASYSSFRVEGSLPEEGALVIAPNHCNTLLDALVVLQSRKAATVFGARADIFRKAGKALRFLKILPMARQRDGLAIQRESYKTFEEIEDTLGAGIPFCLFPEGKHTPGREVQPLRKGIVRIALRSAALRHTLIVPAGLNYSHFFRFRGSALLRYGAPLDVNAFLEKNAALDENELSASLLEELHGRIQGLVPAEGPAWRRRWWALPFWPLTALLALPLWLPAEWLCHKIQDKAFCNSVRYLVKLFLTPRVVLIWAVVFFLLLPWWLALALLVLFLFSYSLFYDALLAVSPLR